MGGDKVPGCAGEYGVIDMTVERESGVYVIIWGWQCVLVDVMGLMLCIIK